MILLKNVSNNSLKSNQMIQSYVSCMLNGYWKKDGLTMLSKKLRELSAWQQVITKRPQLITWSHWFSRRKRTRIRSRSELILEWFASLIILKIKYKNSIFLFVIISWVMRLLILTNQKIWRYEQKGTEIS